MGYVLIDNRVSGGVQFEADTKACKHCQKVLKVTRRKGVVNEVVGVWCGTCGGFRCDPPCTPKGQCEPFQRWVDRRWSELHRG